MKDKKERLHQILLRTAHVPKHLVAHHGRENTAEFVLHSLSDKECFDLSKAAYFIDNPDFNHLQGIAGYHAQESFTQDHWQAPDQFSAHMQNKSFNQIVRGMRLPSIKKSQKHHREAGEELAYTLGIHNPHIISWPVRHDNFGLFVFEPTEQIDAELLDEHLLAGLHLLGFCPIF